MKRLSIPGIAWLLVLIMRPEAFAQSILAESQGISVSDTDVRYYVLENIPADRRSEVMSQEKAYTDLVESLYVVRYLAKEAESQAGLDKEFAAWSAQMKYQRQLVAQYRVDYIRANLGDTDWEALAREAYKAEPESFMSEEKIRASHILIKDSDRGEEEALLLAQELREQAQAGADFAELAATHTEDPAGKSNGGDLGFFTRGRTVPEFETAAFSLKNPGDMSEVVKSPFGYHIIKLTDRQSSVQKPFESVKEELINAMQIKLGNQLWQDKVIAIKSSLRPHIKARELDKFMTDYQSSEVAQ